MSLVCYLQKRKGKPAGKRKKSKVATSKLSNKRLNKLAKQGKLKKSLPKGKYLQLLQQRTGQKKTLPNKNDIQQTVSLIRWFYRLLRLVGSHELYLFHWVTFCDKFSDVMDLKSVGSLQFK